MTLLPSPAGACDSSAAVTGCTSTARSDSIHYRAADTIAVILRAPWRARAFASSLTQIPAAAGVHRGDELKAGGIGNVGGSAGDRRAPGFHRLAQRLQGLARKFGKLV